MHLHIPDGVLPIWLWVLGWAVCVLALAIFSAKFKSETKKISLAAALSALALLVISIPLGLPVHLNLMVLIGILVGPSWALVVALVVNVILALFGHGGITIIGLNTAIFWFEAILGFALFRGFSKIFKNVFFSSVLATFLSLAAAYGVVLLIVAASNINPIEFHEHTGGEEEAEIISLKTFIALSAVIYFVQVIVESFITGLIIKFIKRAKPDLIK